MKSIRSTNYKLRLAALQPSPRVLNKRIQERLVSTIVSKRNNDTSTIRTRVARWLSDQNCPQLAGFLISDYRHLIGSYIPTKWS